MGEEREERRERERGRAEDGGLPKHVGGSKGGIATGNGRASGGSRVEWFDGQWLDAMP